MTTIESTLQVPPPAADAPARVDESGVELKRGAILNTIAMLASNFRGIFTFLVARLLGPAALGIFSVAWSATDVLSKIGVLGLDNAIITFIARSEAVGDRARSRMLFRLAVVLGSLNPLLPRSLSLERSDFLAPVCVCNRKWFLPWPFSCARCRAWRCIASAHLCRVA